MLYCQRSGKLKADTPMDEYRKIGRWIAREFDLFLDVTQVFNVGIQAENDFDPTHPMYAGIENM